ncbi:MAG: type II secretion system F family protein [Nanoarchaeota archaeon]|nr:type II secretion system F family protein [Nanoarchaeota archaeon]MBU4300403.1 type II secretion system F family protein [Nanoarchaeota archaeon]MBU4451355.1 type II secretion system F family protein [Nanoarchaeota archaeon]MCG2723758.1 type II secretion system F family protein [archaeon]
MAEDFNEKYISISYRVMGNFVGQYLVDELRDLRPDIQKANIGISLIEYLSVSLFTSLIVFVFQVPLISIIMMLLLKSVLLGLISGFLFGLFCAIGIFSLFYFYPSLRVQARCKKINESLPFAMFYLTTISGSGTPPLLMFKMLAQFKEYEEISEEAKKIVYDVDIAGMSVTKALENAAGRTPSNHLREIYWGITNSLTTGGDLKSLLYEKANSAMEEYKRSLSGFTAMLSTLTEIYLTGVVVGSIFFMVLSTIMSSFGSDTTTIINLQLAVTFILLPILSVAFIAVLKQISPAHAI